MSRMIKLSIIALSLTLLSGCVTTEQLKAVQVTADAAMAKATDAHHMAQSSHGIASEAAYGAEQAQTTADAALICCNENALKLDRMFEKAISK